ncbi:MAG: DUF4278 domain-containing protein [Nodosilinea sp.]
MQLRFLGAEYARQWPSIETHEGEIAGKYRGVTWNSRHHSASAVAPTRPVTLRFMGRSYQAQV